ncbi:hypothetical protein ES703_37828 [subsurface metagenome]
MIDLFLSVPILYKVLGTLLLILILNHFFKNLLVSVGIGAILLGLWSGHSLGAIAEIAWKRVSSPDNLLLMVVVLQVIWLSTLMSEAGVMQDLVQVIRARIPRYLAFAALPAVIGFLPMPGGAIFSAPLVESCDQHGKLPGQLKAQTNYWFRHIWEFWWPLYPAVLLACDLTGLEIWQFILLQIPLTLLAVGSGYLFLLRRIPREEETKDPPSAAGPSFWFLIAPILAVISSYAIVRLALPSLAGFNKYLPMLIGLFLALIVLRLQRKSSLSNWKRVVFSKRAYSLVLLIAVVRIYGAVLEAPLAGGVLLVEQMRIELSHFGIPLTAVMALIPLISGMAMGLFVGVVGASFPIVLSLIGQDPALGRLLSVTVLSYSFGFMGTMLSPVHVCLVVTNEYFKTQLLHTMISLIKPVSVFLLGALLFSLGIARLWAV